jgi:phage gp16-like protein
MKTSVKTKPKRCPCGQRAKCIGDASCKEEATRKNLIKIIQIDRKQSDLDDGVWQEILKRFGGVEVDGRVSLTTLTTANLQALLNERREKGMQPSPQVSEKIALINEMWKELHQQDKVFDPSEKAMRNAVKVHHKGIDRLEWATPNQLHKIISMLKSWKRRETNDKPPRKSKN